MPGVLVDDIATDHALALPGTLPHPAPSHLSPHVRHYIPVLRSSVAPDFCGGESPPPQRSPLLPPACLNVSSLPDMHTEDGNSLDAALLLQLSPASAPGQWGYSSASPTTRSALAALQQFLPSNFEEDEGEHATHTDVYSCDEFRMYEFKVRRCMRGRSHDWTECPFAHPGEKARRRDPRRFIYSGTACADFRRGSCKKGDACEYAHGVFECWLHPSRYRTQPCKDGRGCRRRICFFAHTPDQLRCVSPMSSPSAASSSPTSLHLCANEAFELCGSPSPYRSPSKKVSSEPFKLPLTSSPLCRMAMEASPDGCFPSAAFSPPASSQSLSTSSPITAINWSLKGISTFALPAAAMPQLHPSPHSNQSQASFAAVPVLASASPAQYGHRPERRNQCLSLPIPQAQSGSNSVSPSPTWTHSYTATSAMQRAENLMDFLKQSDLMQEETDWQGQPASYFDTNTVLQQGSRCSAGEEAPAKKGCSRISEEEILLGRFCDDHEEDGEPKLERVESGKGLRAQIFQSLLRTASQPSCRTYQDSNSEPLRSSSSSLGF